MNFRIFIDMDGVLTDFNKTFRRISGNIGPNEYETKYGTEEFWKLIDSIGEEFWSYMPWTDDGKMLWNTIHTFGCPVYILSAPSKNRNSITGKKKWIVNNLGIQDEVTLSPKKWDGKTKIILNSQKYLFCSGNTDILIDDTMKKIDAWKSRKGIGILHTSAQDTINELRNYLDIVT